jgi:hypothetical protein
VLREARKGAKNGCTSGLPKDQVVSNRNDATGATVSKRFFRQFWCTAGARSILTAKTPSSSL